MEDEDEIIDYTAQFADDEVAEVAEDEVDYTAQFADEECPCGTDDSGNCLECEEEALEAEVVPLEEESPLKTDPLDSKEPGKIDPTETSSDDFSRLDDDISFSEFNNVPEEVLQTTLESQYPWLEFDEPIIYGGSLIKGAQRDVIQITNPETGATEDFALGTDYNKERGEPETAKGAYNRMLTWINEQRFDEEGNPLDGRGKKRTYGPDYLTNDNKELPVSKFITDQALDLVKKDESGELTMDQAISTIVNTELGQENMAWNTNFVNEKNKENTLVLDKVKEEYKKGFNIHVTTGQLTREDFKGRTSILPEEQQEQTFNQTKETFLKLGVPKEVFETPYDKNYFLAKEQGETGNDVFGGWSFLKLEYERNQLIKEQINQYLAETKKGKLITTAFNQAEDEAKRKEETAPAIAKANEEVLAEDQQVKERAKEIKEKYPKISVDNAAEIALKEVREQKANEFIDAKINTFAEKEMEFQAAVGYFISPSDLKSLKERGKKATTKEELEAYRAELRNLVNDGKINLLRNPDGSFVNETLQAQTQAAKDNKKLGEKLDEYMYQSQDELTQELFNTNATIKSLGEQIVREGYTNTVIESSLAQIIGEGYSRLAHGEGGNSSAFVDFKKLENWVNGGEIPIGLTTLPESAGSSDIVKRYNDLIEQRSTLLLAKELNVNPLSFGKSDFGIVRAAQSFGQELIPALGGRYVGEEEHRSNALDIFESAYGITRTESQEFMANHLGGWEKAGQSTAPLVVMAGEMALTYPLFGGARGLTKGIYALTEAALTTTAKKTAMSPGFIKALSTYTSHVGTEYVGLVGSNIMEREIFNREGIHNPLLFAMGSGGARTIFAKGGRLYNDAVKNAAKTNPGLQRSLLWVSEQPTTASVDGALKFKALAQSATRTGVKGGLVVGEALTGAVGIKAGEGLAGITDVIQGKKTMSHLWSEITDVDSLLETAAALVFMKSSRPDQYVGKAVADFYAECDMIAGNNPQWNRLRNSIGLERLGPKAAKEAAQDPNYLYNLQVARAKKFKEIKNGEGDYEGFTQEQKEEAYKDLKYTYQKLEMKPELDKLAEMYKKPDGLIGSYSDLEIASNNVAAGSMNARDILTLASAPSGGSSPVIQLMANGFSEKVATQIYDFSLNQKAIGMEFFGGNLRGKAFENYVTESVKLNELNIQKQSLEKTYKENKIDQAAYEIKNERLDEQIDASVERQIKEIKEAEIEREVKGAKSIKELEDKGFNIIKGDSEVIKKFKEENGGEYKETELGLQGIDKTTGKGVILINTEATKKFGKAGTETHEVWHFPFERKLGDQAIEARAKVIAKDTRDIEGARKQAEQEAKDYVQKFTEGLKKRGIFEVVEAEMQQRSVFNSIIKGEDVPLSEMKEFINEFIQLDKNGSFDAAKSREQVKASKKQEGKDITKAEYDASLKDPQVFVDFVLSGKYKAKNINDFLKAEQDAYTKEFGGEKEATMQASERAPVKIEAIKSVGKDGEVISAERVEKQLGKVAGMAWKKYGSKVGGLDRREYTDRAISELYKPLKASALDPTKKVPEGGYSQWIKKWDGTRQSFEKYTLQKGLEELKLLARDAFGVESNEVRAKQKRLSDKVNESGDREFDVADPDAQKTVEGAADSKSKVDVETDRQVSVFESREAKAKEKEITSLFKELTPQQLIERSKKGLAGTPNSELTKVAELLFDLENGGKVTDLSVSSYPSVELVNPNTGKKLTPKQIEKGAKGIIDSRDFVNIRNYFKDARNLDRYLKTMPEYNITGDRSRINSKGETIEVSKDVKGKGMRLTDRVYDYFYEPFINHPSKPGYDAKLIQTTPVGRSKGKTTQPYVKRLKPEFRDKISPEVIKKLREDLLLDTKVEDLINVYDRTTHGQLIKGMAKLEVMKIASEATRKPLPKETEADKKFEADLRAGSSDFAASERMVRGMSDLIEAISKGEIVNIDKIIVDRGIKGEEALVFHQFKKPGSLAQLKQAIDNGVVDRVMLNELIKMDLASPEGKRQLEKISIRDIARREGITEQQVRDRYIKNAWQKNAKELLESLGYENKGAKGRGSAENYKKAKPYIKDFIQRLIPKGKSFGELPSNYQQMLLKTLGFGDGTLSTSTKLKDGSWQVKGQQLNGRPFTYKEYAKDGVKNGDINGLLKKALGLTEADLKGKGKDIDAFAEEFYYPNDWGGKARNISKLDGLVLSEIKSKGKDNFKPRGKKEVEYEDLLGANKKALQRLYDVMKEVVLESKNPTEALEHMIDLQLSQTNRATGGIKGLVGMESVTTKKAKSKPGSKDVHNEHLSELFSMTKDFSLMMDRYIKGEQSLEGVDKQLKRMVDDASQALITEKRRDLKDASGAAVRDYMNNLIFLGKDAKSQIPLKEGVFGDVENMVEFIRDKATADLIKQIKDTPYNDLTEIGVLTKLQVENPKRVKKVKNNNIEVAKEARMNASERLTNKEIIEELGKRDKAIRLANKINKPIKKARVFDFDDTVARTKNKVFATKDGKKKILTAEEFAKEGERLEAEGWEMDFSDFNKVVDGKKGPLFEVMKKMKEAAGDRDMFILTARAQESAPAIHRFLKEMGIDIPLENIKGLGDGSPYAKSDWIVEKAAEGYNDFYFADDAYQNVKAVRDALEVIDVKSKTQQARMNASEKLNTRFNEIIEESTGIGREKIFSDIKAEIRGEKTKRQRFFIPPSAEDFTGLLYTTLGKGKKGEQAMEFYKENLLDPYTRAMENLSQDRVNLMQDFTELKKELDVPKDLRKKTKSGFRNEDAVRAYLWQKTGKEIPGISKTDLAELNKIIESDPKLKVFADQILTLTKGDGYSTPGKDWNAGTITTDLMQLLNKGKRAKYLEQWKENVDVIFSKKNLNKLEAAYGKKYREALENSLTRMKAGTNRTSSGNKLSNRVLDYVNNATGVVMFLNARSAVLQTISAANFTNWTFNSPLKMGKAFANQPQYWKDFIELINSDYLKDRRNGLKLNISESEIANAAAGSKNKAKAVVSYIIEKGYLPTKFADSFAIASGGAMFYRNKINDLIKNHGKSEAEAKKIAMEEFRSISEKSQQSSDPSKISQQQASDLGRIVLSFANTPMQYARIQKRAIQDIANGRGSMKENVGKVIYYGFLQNMMFNALQQGMFALGFGDGEIGEEEEKKMFRTMNGMLDSQLRGLGMAGVTVQVLKNLGIDIYDRSQRDRPEYSDAWIKLLEFSPAIKSKLSRFKGAAYPFDSKKRRQEVFDKGFSLDNPAYESMAKVVSGVTNIPLDRLYSKINNLQAASQEETETWKAVAMVMGWPEWQLRTTADVNKGYRNDPSQWSVWEQKSILRQLGYSDDEIKKLKNTEGRAEVIKKLQKEPHKQVFPKDEDKKDFHNVTKKEKEENKNLPLSSKQKLTSMKKGEQVRHLTNYGLSKAEIRALRYEADRVAKLIELAGKPEKVDSLMKDIDYTSQF